MGRTVKIVLDTRALIWWSLDPDKLSPSASDVCNQMETKKMTRIVDKAIVNSYLLTLNSYLLTLNS